MASIIKPSMLRQACSAASKRPFSTKLSPVLPAIKTPSTSTLAQRTVRSKLVRDALPGSIRVAAFHASGRRPLLPPLPQVIEGTTNDPAPIPATNPAHGSYHWTFERLISVALIPLTIAPFASGSLNPMTDAILCGAILIHSHIGFESVIIDYVPPKRLPKTRKVIDWSLRAATVLVAVGLYEFETNDVGVTEAIKRVWTA